MTPEQEQEQEQGATLERQTPPPVPAPARRSRWRWLKWTAATLALLVLLVVGLAYTALSTDWGARNGWQLVTRVLGGALSGEIVGGSVAHGLDLRNIRYRDQERTITIDRVRGAWDFRFTPRSSNASGNLIASGSVSGSAGLGDGCSVTSTWPNSRLAMLSVRGVKRKSQAPRTRSIVIVRSWSR